MVEQVRGMGRTIKQSFTRPADTTAYAAGDVVCNSTSAPVIMQFNVASKEAGALGIIQQAILIDSESVATKPDLELWLFDTTITMDNDNAAFTPTDAELLTLVGVIPFLTSTFKVGTASGNSICQVDNLGIPFNTLVGDNTLYGVLVVRNAYVPVSGETFTVRLKCLD